ncbi:lipopolysaccharide assembly protein LapA domain-containing protein [Psychrobacter sp. FDAARGOS_221]|uniref:lipopolysaccharide assembly protein LapA domain-containing protein n=1 Tax=Psychrobacter sp. FDAARGOS_221 TaxID=1975705 RepID=UPI001D0D0992|nr:lipopolysaccharide assembly protein LapA domain-containing protein [Psychrobacter sp. FDAARGOS_221]
MRFVLMILLFVIFGYSLGLVLVNSSEVAVNLLFSQAPEMNLGLLLILCIGLGVLIGMLLALLLFKVLQNKWEIGRLNKENRRLKEELTQATVEIERHSLANQADKTVFVDSELQSPTPNQPRTDVSDSHNTIR